MPVGELERILLFPEYVAFPCVQLFELLVVVAGVLERYGGQVALERSRDVLVLARHSLHRLKVFGQRVDELLGLGRAVRLLKTTNTQL